MSEYKTKISHDLGQKEAIKRLKENIEWARGISDLQGAWTENIFTFSVSIQGIVLKGNFQVEDNSLKSKVHLPLIAMPFKGWFPNILRNALKKRTVDNEKVQLAQQMRQLSFFCTYRERAARRSASLFITSVAPKVNTTRDLLNPEFSLCLTDFSKNLIYQSPNTSKSYFADRICEPSSGIFGSGCTNI